MRHKILGLPAVLSLLLLAMPVHAHEAGQWVYKVGVGTVVPDDSVLLPGILGPGTSVEVDAGSSATFTLTYFFTRNLAFDLLAAFPFDHDIVLVTDGVGAKIADTNHLPPTFSLQYHLAPEGNFRPYVGVGANWTTFFNTDVTPELEEAGFYLDLESSFSWAAQLGADFLIGDDWLVNADVRYIDLESDAFLRTPSGNAAGPVGIDPMVYSLSIGYRF